MLSIPPERWEDGLYNLGGSCCLAVLEVAHRIAKAYEKCFGRSLEIQVPEIREASEPPPFDYSTKKLEKAGLTLFENMEEEIRGTFKLCASLRT